MWPTCWVSLRSGRREYRFRTMVRSQGARSLSDGKPEGARSLTIGELAAAGGVGVETIRFYQRKDLLRTPSRGDGIRHYGRDDVRRLRFIRQAQAAHVIPAVVPDPAASRRCPESLTMNSRRVV